MHRHKAADVAKSCGLTTEALNEYVSNGLIRPSRLYGSTGYRHYDITYIDRILQIADFRDEGYSFEWIKDYLTSDRYRQGIDEIELEEVPHRRCLAFELEKAGIENKIVSMRDAVSECISKGVLLSRKNPNFFMIKDKYEGEGGTNIGEEQQLFSCVTTDEKYDMENDRTLMDWALILEIPKQTCLTMISLGDDEGINLAYHKLATEAARRKYEIDGSFQEEYVERASVGDMGIMLKIRLPVRVL